MDLRSPRICQRNAHCIRHTVSKAAREQPAVPESNRFRIRCGAWARPLLDTARLVVHVWLDVQPVAKCFTKNLDLARVVHPVVCRRILERIRGVVRYVYSIEVLQCLDVSCRQNSIRFDRQLGTPKQSAKAWAPLVEIRMRRRLTAGQVDPRRAVEVSGRVDKVVPDYRSAASAPRDVAAAVRTGQIAVRRERNADAGYDAHNLATEGGGRPGTCTPKAA